MTGWRNYYTIECMKQRMNGWDEWMQYRILEYISK